MTLGTGARAPRHAALVIGLAVAAVGLSTTLPLPLYGAYAEAGAMPAALGIGAVERQRQGGGEPDRGDREADDQRGMARRPRACPERHPASLPPVSYTHLTLPTN